MEFMRAATERRHHVEMFEKLNAMKAGETIQMGEYIPAIPANSVLTRMPDVNSSLCFAWSYCDVQIGTVLVTDKTIEVRE